MRQSGVEMCRQRYKRPICAHPELVVEAKLEVVVVVVAVVLRSSGQGRYQEFRPSLR